MRRFLLLFALAVACNDLDTDPGAELDGETDDIGDGKADTGGIRPNTADAYAVVNFASSALDADIRAAGLGPQATANILAFRDGDDEQAGTEDDGVFKSLEELDAVPYVGPKAFKAMLAYTRGKALWLRPPVDGAWNIAFDTVSGVAPVKVSANIRVEDNGEGLHSVTLSGSSRTLAVIKSYFMYDFFVIDIAGPLTVGNKVVTDVFIFGGVEDGSLLCGTANVLFADGTDVNRIAVATRGTLPANPTATLCR